MLAMDREEAKGDAPISSPLSLPPVEFGAHTSGVVFRLPGPRRKL